jgi:hypothetical protein
MPLEFFDQRRPNLAAVADIKRWTTEVFHLPESASVLVTELRCAEPGCPPLETVIAILDPAPARQVKIPKPVAEVTFLDVAERGASTPSDASHQG